MRRGREHCEIVSALGNRHSMTNTRNAIRTVAGSFLLAAVLVVPDTALAQDAMRGQSVQAGARLFRTKGCLGCHPIGAEGVGPDLRSVEGGRSFYGLAAAMWNHLPRMRAAMEERGVPVPGLDAWEAGDLVAFLFWLGYFDEPGDTARGASLFQSKSCVACHQVRGVGGVLGPDLDVHASGSPIMVASAMWNHLPAMLEAHSAQGLRRSQVTGDELRDIVAYIEGGSSLLPRGSLVVMPGRSGRGRQVFETKGCIQCHAVRSIGGTVGPDLGVTGRYATMLDFAAALWNKAPGMLALMQRRGIEPVELGPEDMADLVAFLYAGRYFGDAGTVAAGRRVAQSSRCQGCHAGAAAVGGDLGRVRGIDSPAAVVAALWNHVLNDEAQGALPTLSSKDIADVSAYLQQVGGSQ